MPMSLLDIDISSLHITVIHYVKLLQFFFLSDQAWYLTKYKKHRI